MNIRVEHKQGRVPLTVFYIQGQINMGSTAQLEQMASAEFDNGMRNLLIDFSETTSLPSAGLRTLLWLYRLLEGSSPRTSGPRPKSSHLKLLNLPPNLRSVAVQSYDEGVKLIIARTVDALVADFPFCVLTVSSTPMLGSSR